MSSENPIDQDQQRQEGDRNRDQPRPSGDRPAATGSGAASTTRPEGHRPRSNRGFAAMDAARQREIASKGGQSQGKANNPGNFANDRQKAREAGRKGGLA